MEGITYCLQNAANGPEGSGEFYVAVDRVTDMVLREAEVRGLGKIDQTQEEATFELLLLGVLWNTYRGEAEAFPTVLSGLFAGLYHVRKTWACAKPSIDKVRGFLTCILMRQKAPEQELSLCSLHQLLAWLEATYEYKEEVKRLRRWETFFASQPAQVRRRQMESIVAFAMWFEQESQAALGEFTRNVNRFLEDEYKTRRFREDTIFCGRRRVEYHLNMVGATIMNRDFRPEFLATDRKVVLLPLCMSAKASGGCRAVKQGKDVVCVGCTEECSINRIRQLGKKQGFSIRIVPHSSGFTQWLEQWRDQNHTGVVAVACVLNLLAGGYEMKSLHIPAQCVFLDYCGCSKHWKQEDLPTNIDAMRLQQVTSSAEL